MDQIQRVAKQAISLLVIPVNLTTLMMSLNLAMMILMNPVKRKSQEREVQEAAEIMMIPMNLMTLMSLNQKTMILMIPMNLMTLMMGLILVMMIPLNLMILMMNLNPVTMIPMIPMNPVKRENQEGAV